VVEKENKRLSNEKESKITEKPATQEWIGYWKLISTKIFC
jgi:hypothetical protein